jgi:hypothetical protein
VQAVKSPCRRYRREETFAFLLTRVELRDERVERGTTLDGGGQVRNLPFRPFSRNDSAAAGLEAIS